MLRIEKKHVIYSMNDQHKPAAFCSSGDTVQFETMDCFSDQITSESDQITEIDFERVNPATGPLFINGAMPGDVLEVVIEQIEVADYGTMTAAPNLGALGHLFNRSLTKRLPVNEQGVQFMDELTLPFRPMIGVIGTAPLNETVNNGTPGEHGGNLDTKDICPDARLFLPVNIEGALLSIGDLHAAMGDGEVLICGVEIAGLVTVTVNVHKDRNIPLPSLQTDTEWMTIASADTLDEASIKATEKMAQYVASQSKLSFEETGMLLSAVGDLRVSQIVNPKKTARYSLPLAVVQQLCD